MATLNYQRVVATAGGQSSFGGSRSLREGPHDGAGQLRRGTKKISGETWWKQLTCWHLPLFSVSFLNKYGIYRKIAIPIIIYPYLWELYISIVSICQYTYTILYLHVDVQRMFWTSSQPRTQNLLRACCEARSEKPCHVKHQIAWWTQHLGRRMFSSLVGNGLLGVNGSCQEEEAWCPACD